MYSMGSFAQDLLQRPGRSCGTGKLPNAQGHRRDLQHENKATTKNTAYLESTMFVSLYPVDLPTSQTIC